MERILSLHGNYSTSEHNRISVILSTSSQEDVNFTVRLYEVEDFSTAVLNHHDPSDPDEVNTTVKDVVAHSAEYRYVDLRGKDQAVDADFKPFGGTL